MGFVSDIFSGPPDPPAAPNPTNTIEEQARYNQITQLTPTGNIVYGEVGADGAFVPREDSVAVQVQETPFQEEFRETSEGLALGLAQGLDPNLTGFRSASDIERGIQTPLLGDFSEDARRIEQATFEQGASRLDPIIEQERNDLVQNLADRGIPLSSEAAQKELDRFDQSVGDRRADLAYGAIEAGRVEQNRLASLTSQLRGQEVNEQLAFGNLEQQQRAQQFGELGSLGGFATPFQNINPTTVDAAGIINQGYANQLQRNQIQSQNYATSLGFAGDLASAGATAYAASDMRLKHDIEPYDTKNGYNRYTFKYNDDKEGKTYLGVMAQEVGFVNPDSVTIREDGMMIVDYAKLGFPMEEVSDA